MKPYSLKITGRWLLLVLLLATVQHIQAQSRSGIVLRKVLDGAENRLAVDSSIMVQDSIYFNPLLISKLDTPYAVRNIITFKINEYSNLYLPASFNATVNVRIYYTKANSTVDSIDRELTINYDTANTYSVRNYFVFNNSHRVNVKVLSFTTNAGTNVLPALMLENEMELHPVYKLNCTADAVKSIASNNPPVTDSTDEITVNWPVTLGADVYDLEWAYIDSSALESGRYGSPLNAALIFANNTTRVTISANSYAIPLLYDNGGVLFYRVRAVQEKKEYRRMETDWSTDFPGGLGSYAFCGHQRNLNWQSSVTFAEEGKRKIEIQYFDGSLRGRQAITKDNTTNTIIVAESFYDYHGRPAIEVMPAPTINTVLKYTANLNNAVNGAEYDKDQYDRLETPADFLLASAKQMSTSSGSNQYYSPNNPDKLVGISQYIPDAEGYAFVETEYVQDNTGRISRVSSAGRTFKLGGGHESKYTYGTAPQEDLDALFGTEVGYNTHYFKNTARDANGQYSVTYLDMHGRTIATALAGSPLSASLDDLPTKDVTVKTDSLSGVGKNIVQDLRLESRSSQTVAEAGTYTFKYELTSPVLRKKDCNGVEVCYNALYDLNIRITDDAYNQRLGGKPFDTVIHSVQGVEDINNSCTPKQLNFEFSIFLREGSYEITKSLAINKEAMDYYRDSIFLKSSLCTSVEQIIAAKKEEQRSLDCFPTCESCLDSIGNWDNFRVKYVLDAGHAIQDTALYRDEALHAYQAAIVACDELCGTTTDNDDIRKVMLMDMTPPFGQYANLVDTLSKHSVFYLLNDNSVMPYARDTTRFTDDSGKPDLVYDEETGGYITPNKLSKQRFVEKFRASWAEALLKFHPEYCKFLQREKFKTAMQWDKTFRETDSYQEAKTKGYLNPLGMPEVSFASPGTLDPVKLQDVTNKLANRLKSYSVTTYNGKTYTYSAWSMATIGVKCQQKDQACTQQFATIAASFDETKLCTGDLDMAWRNFREIYLMAKNEVIMEIVADKSKTSCPVGKLQPTAAELVAETISKTPRFGNTASSMQMAGLDKYNKPGQTEQAVKDTARAQQMRMYDANCRAYVALWKEQLSACGYYTPLALQEITNKLIIVCKEGSDMEHPRGASSVRPASTYQYKSFEQVINEYNQAHGITDALNCTALRITTPKPYGRQPIYTNNVSYTKPQDCECNKLKDLQVEYTALRKIEDTSLSVYIKRTRGVLITTSTINALLDACMPAVTGGCTFLPRPVTIPALLQCRPAPACVSCDNVRLAHNDFLSAYPSILPSLENVDSLQQEMNERYAVYMNNRFGFGLQAWQYLSYIDSCDIGIGGSSYQVCRPGNPRYREMVSTYAKSGTDVMMDVQHAADSGYIMAGSTTNTGYGGRDAYIIKTGRNGDVKWAKSFGGEAHDEFVRIRATADSGYIAIGSTYSYCFDLGAMFIVRLDAVGNVLWNKVVDFGFDHGAKGTDIIQTSEGKFAFAGLRSNATTHTNWVMGLLDEDGEMSWLKQIGDATGLQDISLVEHNDTLVAGTGLLATDADAAIIKLKKQNGALLKYDQYDLESKGNVVSGILKTPEGGYKLSLVNLSTPGGTTGEGVLMDVNGAGNIFIAQKVPAPAGGISPASWNVAMATDGGYFATQSASDVYWHKIRTDNSVQWSRQVRTLETDRLFRFMQDETAGDLIGAGVYDGQRAMLMFGDVNGRTGCNDTLLNMNATDITLSSVRKTVTLPAVVNLKSTAISTVHIGESFITLGRGTVNCPGTDTCFMVSTAVMLCGSAAPVYEDLVLEEISSCSDSTFFAVSAGTDRFNYYQDSVKNDFDQSYVLAALDAAAKEKFAVTYSSSEYHYTLYYYDQAGNLVKTVPPAGVVKDRSHAWLDQVKSARNAGQRLVPAHTMETSYRYNTLNQVIAQKTPDAGISNFWYDKLGRLIASQDAQQSTHNHYSYTQFDWLGRVTEVGEITSMTAMTDGISRKEHDFASWMNAAANSKTQIVETFYDVYTPLEGLVWNASNLRNRVAWSASFNTAADLANGDRTTATFYDYDIHGNVKVLLQDFNSQHPNNAANRFKKIMYDYDLISGKTHIISYQPGQIDAFYHRYNYDAENRLVNVETSTDSVYWENDAYYQFYKHGSPARMVLGQQQVQGLDLAYTLNGWLKGMNSTTLTSVYDIGRDGETGGITAKDAFGFSLHYFGENEYKPINQNVKPFAAAIVSLKPLYNGNITGASINVTKLDEPLFYKYSYDVLNRLAGMDVSKNINVSDNVWNPIAVDDFRERITYDPNGNILSYLRNGNATWAGLPLQMDRMAYHYEPGKNRLSYIIDTVPSGNYDMDIDSMDVNNYVYDAIGNLLQDKKDSLSFEWTLYGKIRKITKDNGMVISYTYDALGNRVSKNVNGVETRYVRDAAGQIFAIYESGNPAINNGKLSLTESHMYGGERLGLLTRHMNVQTPDALPIVGLGDHGIAINSEFVRGEKLFEIVNHVGSVMAMVSDVKLAKSNGNATVDHYEANIVSALDYYPAGMLMPGRKYTPNGRYRHEYQGQETDKEFYDGAIAFAYRIEDPRIARFLSVDPLDQEFPWNSPYAVQENKFGWGKELEGLEIGLGGGLFFSNTPLLGTTDAVWMMGETGSSITGASTSTWLGTASSAAQGGGLSNLAVTGNRITPIPRVIPWGSVPLIPWYNDLGPYLTKPSPNVSPAPTQSSQKQPETAPNPQRAFDPKQSPTKEDNGDDGYYIYETGSKGKVDLGIVDKSVGNLPYFGITKDAVIGGRYQNSNPRAKNISNYRGILGKTNKFLAEGVESALIALNTYGKNFERVVLKQQHSSTDVIKSTRIDNKKFSHKDRLKIMAGVAWLRLNYGANWKTNFLHKENKKKKSK
ncbi:RHS repeat domain-containing protein [Chitinophaga niabensis]|uniref:YD repeat-containing protein n=1 Tax=Chitinophaga niabensis TaxID=536979 RepID=A0A1N6DEI7_9BACT|nr:hypothetical protein [Chitinophaga niabensis]SIN69220.1 YD repeat-containing protein [Chitinophaga niabensis]